MPEYPATQRPDRCPTHPGQILKLDVFPALNLSITAAARALGVSRQQLHKILRDENPEAVSPEMAVRLGALCGNGPNLWINMQKNYDQWHAERKVDVRPILEARKEIDQQMATA